MTPTQYSPPQSSPHSSEVCQESSEASPESIITTFSPEEVRIVAADKARRGAKPANIGKPPPAFSIDNLESEDGSQQAFHLPNFLSSINTPKLAPLRLTKTGENNSVHAAALGQMLREDPFLGASSVQKLSPTAALFTPSPSTSAIAPERLDAFILSDAPKASYADETQSQLPVPDLPLSNVFSTDLGISRAFKIVATDANLSAKQLGDMLNTKSYLTFRGMVLVDFITLRTAYLAFSDIREAIAVFKYAKAAHPNWQVEGIPPNKYYQKQQPGCHTASPYEGQIMLKASLVGYKAADGLLTKAAIVNFISGFGKLYAFEASKEDGNKGFSFRAEFCDTDGAESIQRVPKSFKLSGLLISVGPYEPVQTPVISRSPYFIQGSTPLDSADYPPSRTHLHDISKILERISLESTCSLGSFSHPQSPLYSPTGFLKAHHCMRPSLYENPSLAYELPGQLPSRRTLSHPSSLVGAPHYAGGYYHQQMGGLDIHGPVGQERNQLHGVRTVIASSNSSRQSMHNVSSENIRRGDTPGGHHNVVDIERICQGLDVRTTIMLRNIPNKVKASELKDIVDETSFGRYDFMYLRIDFQNVCNVGYAFINFEDPFFIVDFVKARAGQPWNKYNSDKIAEVSYATIQGKDCLVQKFRNSSVMLEHPDYRPKIFHTGDDPLAGMEEEFPGPDNPSKMRRSVENAEHVGLFAPRAGQNFRDEQRRRRSQYDRGTRLAELEEADGDECFSIPLTPESVFEHLYERRPTSSPTYY